MQVIARGFHLLVLLVITAVSGSAFGAYSFVSIDCPGAGNTDAFGINNSGTVVGNCYDADGNSVGAYSYDSHKRAFTTVAPAPGLDTALFGINEKGEMVGSVSDGTNVLGYVRSKKGVYTTFMHPGSSDTEARGNNNNGLVAGLYVDDASGTIFGFLYDTGSKTFVTPGDLVPNSLQTIAQGVNNQGQVVGSARLPDGAACTGCPFGRYGFMRNKNGGVTYFQVNGAPTAARGITDSGVITGFIATGDEGQAAGFAITLAASPQFQAFTIPAAQLLMFPGAFATFAQGMANNGTVVGGWNEEDGTEHGFIATKH